MNQVSLIPILLFVAALASAGIAVWRGPRPIDRSFVSSCYLFVFARSSGLGLRPPHSL